MIYSKQNIKPGFLSAIVFVAIILATSLNSCYYDKSDLLYPDTACDTAAVKYSTSVLPVLSSNCVSCHGGTAPSAGISLDTYTGVKLQVDNGRLWGAVSHSPAYSPMPKNSNKLNTCSLEKIRLWIAAGAPNN
jgi:mono/diheme cytochrome c family protein